MFAPSSHTPKSLTAHPFLVSGSPVDLLQIPFLFLPSAAPTSTRAYGKQRVFRPAHPKLMLWVCGAGRLV